MTHTYFINHNVRLLCNMNVTNWLHGSVNNAVRRLYSLGTIYSKFKGFQTNTLVVKSVKSSYDMQTWIWKQKAVFPPTDMCLILDTRNHLGRQVSVQIHCHMQSLFCRCCCYCCCELSGLEIAASCQVPQATLPLVENGKRLRVVCMQFLPCRGLHMKATLSSTNEWESETQENQDLKEKQGKEEE